MKQLVLTLVGLVLFGTLITGIIWVLYQIWNQFDLLDPTISVALLTAATTVLVATITVVVGKYYERKKDIEAHYRSQKVDIYDQFLRKLFEIFYASHGDRNKEYSTDSLVTYLREWQRKMILWGGQDVLRQYILWISHLKKGVPDVQTMIMMGKLFLEIRKDLGHKNNKLDEGTFISLLLKNPDLFMKKAKETPNLTLKELSRFEADSPG